MPFDTFISYSTKDKASADAACAALEAAGIRCWIAPRDVVPGSDWGSSIVEALNGCRLMVLIFSSSANESPQIRNEVVQAVNRGVPVVPVRIEDVQPTKGLAYFMGAVHWLDALTPPLEQHLQRLADSVKALLHINADKPAGVEAPAQVVPAFHRASANVSASVASPPLANPDPLANATNRSTVISGFEAIILMAFGLFLITYPLLNHGWSNASNAQVKTVPFEESGFQTPIIAIMVSWLLLVGGIAGLIRTSWAQSTSERPWAPISAVLMIVLSGALFTLLLIDGQHSPDIDCLANGGEWCVHAGWSLGLTLIAYFVVAGAVSIILAMPSRRRLSDSWAFLLANGAVNVGLAAIMISLMLTRGLDYANWDVLSVLIGVHLVAAGGALMAMSLVTPKAAASLAPAR